MLSSLPARAEALALAHHQRVGTYSQAHEGRRAQLDAHFAKQSKGLAQALQDELVWPWRSTPRLWKASPRAPGRHWWHLDRSYWDRRLCPRLRYCRAFFRGASTDPVGPSLEILPGENPGETGAIIPGFGREDDLPAPGLVNNEPAEETETGAYGDLERRSIRDDMDVDHIPAQGAIKLWLENNVPYLSPYQVRALTRRAPAVVIPTHVHRRYSET